MDVLDLIDRRLNNIVLLILIKYIEDISNSYKIKKITYEIESRFTMVGG